MTTIWSVTDTPCSCGYLQRCAADPDLPIEFDRTTNEFNFRYATKLGDAYLIIRHCPFCGGAAPDSLRETLFATVSQDEIHRLTKLFAGLKSLAEVIEKHGPPDHDFDAGSMSTQPEKDGRPSRTEVYRTLVYDNLSETASVSITDHHSDRVGIVIQGKYIGSTEAPL